MKTANTSILAAFALIFLRVAMVVQAQDYTFTTTNGTVTITKYKGPGGDVTIPEAVDGLPVTRIGNRAFEYCTSLTSVTIPNTVTNIGYWAFASCSNLTAVTIGESVTSLQDEAFACCVSLTNAMIPGSVTYVGFDVFNACFRLTEITVDAASTHFASVDGVLFNKRQTALIQYPAGKAGSQYTVPSSVTWLCDGAFAFLPGLTALYFEGNAPTCEWWATGPFWGNNATVYYLPGTTGWGAQYCGHPTALWRPLVEASGPAFGARTNGFGFSITWASGWPIVVEACTNLANPRWSPLRTLILTNGSSYFSDPQWTNQPARVYRVRSV